MGKSTIGWSRLSAALIAIALVFYAVITSFKSSDFTVFLEASKLIAEDKNPYGEWLFVSEGNYCQYFYSPLWALIFIPFTFGPTFIPSLIWLLFSVYFLFRIYVLLNNYLKDIKLTDKEKMWIFGLSFILVIRFVLYTIGMVQMTIFLVWGALEAMRIFKTNKWIWGSLLLAFVINIKLLPLVFFPYLIYRGHFKQAIFVIVFLVFFLLLPAAFLGWDFNQELVKGWFSTINPINNEHLIETELGPHSLTALIPTLLTETEGAIDLTRNILSLQRDQAILVMNFVRLGLVISTIYFIKGQIFTEAKTRFIDLYALSYLFVLIPLIFPHQQKYAFFSVLPAVFYLLTFLFSQRLILNVTRFRLICLCLGLSFVLMTLTTDGLVGRDLNIQFQHYKLLTYGTLLLIPALLLANPLRSKV